MAALRHSLNFQLSHELPPLGIYAQQILENSKTVVTHATPTIMATATTTTTTSAPLQQRPTSDILQKIGATLINSIQLKKYMKIDNTPLAARVSGGDKMDVYGFGMPPPLAPPSASNHITIDSTGFEAMDEMERQLKYDKFMNEVWIGVVLTLVLISMIFCICSCFLYHQFRAWKRTYRNTIAESLHNLESETRKLYNDIDDPVPEYTLVSGLPSYEAALELLNKTPQSCLLVHPSIFHVNEKTASEQQQQHQQLTTPQLSRSQAHLVEIGAPLLPPSTLHSEIQNQMTSPTQTKMAKNIVMAGKAYALLPTYEEASNSSSSSSSSNVQRTLMGSTNVKVTAVNEKSNTVSDVTTLALIEPRKEKQETRTATATTATTITVYSSAADRHIKTDQCNNNNNNQHKA